MSLEALTASTFDWLITGLWRALCLALPLLLFERLVGLRFTIRLRTLMLFAALAVIVLPPISIGFSAAVPVLAPPVVLADQTALQNGLLFAWLLVATLLLARHLWRWRSLAAWLDGQSVPATGPAILSLRESAEEIGLKRVPRLRIALSDHPACIYGFSNLRIVIPQSMLDNPPLLRNALRHELTHAKRNDPHWQWLFSVLACVFWFNPLMHYLARRMHQLRELGCDASLSRRLGHATRGYFESLLTLSAQAHLGLSPVHRFVESPSLLMQRLKALEDGSSQRVTSWYSVLLAIVLAVAAVTLGQTMQRSALFEEKEMASDSLNTVMGDGPGVGSMHVKFAAHRLAAAQKNLEEKN